MGMESSKVEHSYTDVGVILPSSRSGVATYLCRTMYIHTLHLYIVHWYTLHRRLLDE